MRVIIPEGVSYERLLEQTASQLLLSKEELISEIEKQKKKPYVSSESEASFFIPNTYEVYWNVSPASFVKKIIAEKKRFWKKYTLQLKKIRMSQTEVYRLASIIEKETTKKKERPRIAGVYINRLKSGMHLQADPTVNYIYDFSLKRILNKHLQNKSPYNTYKIKGLPPGPICIPSLNSIISVLFYERHSYLFFCARADYSGYHDFAKTYSEHLKNARKYQGVFKNNTF